jgi:hypothetical protein
MIQSLLLHVLLVAQVFVCVADAWTVRQAMLTRRQKLPRHLVVLCHNNNKNSYNKEMFFPHNQELTPAQQSLLNYVEKVKQEMDPSLTSTTTGEGIQCEGEPSVDPSKLIQPSPGDSEWID